MVDVGKLLAAITETEQMYVPDEPEDEFDFVIPKDEELHTLSCAHLMCGQNSKCSCTSPADVLRRCAADRNKVSFCQEALRLEGPPSTMTLARLILVETAAGYGISTEEETG